MTAIPRNLRTDKCVECGRVREIQGRGLCRASCYPRAWRDGRLDEFPLITPPVEQGIGTVELLKELDGAITYRQLDTWLRAGWIGSTGSAAGCGSRRYFTPAEVAAVRALAEEYNASRAVLDRISSGERWVELTALVEAVQS